MLHEIMLEYSLKQKAPDSYLFFNWYARSQLITVLMHIDIFFFHGITAFSIAGMQQRAIPDKTIVCQGTYMVI